jgi:hypothetical protein
MMPKPLKDLYIGSDYVAPRSFLEKWATFRLSPHVSNWPIEVLKILGENYPHVVDNMRPATVDLEKVNKDTGMGSGGIIVWAKREAPSGQGLTSSERSQSLPAGPSIVIPFVVRNFEMTPLDVFISGKKVLPLTPKRIAEEMGGEEIFSGVDRSRGGDVSNLSQLQPPAEAFYGQFGQSGAGGGGGFGRFAKLGKRMLKAAGGRSKIAMRGSDADSMILQQVLSTTSPTEMRSFSDRVYRDPATLAQFVKNKNVDVLQRIIKANPITASDIKNVERWAFPKNVLLFHKVSPGQWEVRSFNDFFPSGDTLHLSERQLLEEFSDYPQVNERAWNTDGFIVTVGHKEVSPVVWHDNMEADTTAIHTPGVWLAVSGNKQVMKGFAWTGYCDYHENCHPETLWYDGQHWSIQDKMQGEHLADEEWEFSEGFMKPGVWFTWLHTHENGEQHPMTPFKVVAVYASDSAGSEGSVTVRATDMFGHDVTFLIRSGIEKIHSATGIIDPAIAEGLGGNAFFVPKETPIITLGSQRIRMVEHARELAHAFRDTAISNLALSRDKAHPATTLVVTCTDKESSLYRLEGNIMEPLTGANACDVGQLKAKWVLVMLGCSVEEAGRILEQAHSMPSKHVYVMSLRPMKYEANIRANKLGEIMKVADTMRVDLLKEAAYIKDKNSVDALLSLNFVSPENLLVFLQNVDTFRDVEAKLAKLLLLTRFGLEAVPEPAVANALKNLNIVTESLEMLQGVLGNQMTPEGEMEFDDKPEDREAVPLGADTTNEV